MVCKRKSKIKLMCGDCLDVMPSISEQSVDMILCDLPYEKTRCEWDSIIPLDRLWPLYKRVIKQNGVIVLTCSQPFTSMLVNSNKKMFRYEYIWNKILPSGFQSCRYRPLLMHENILVFYEKMPIYNPITTPRIRHRKQEQPNTISKSNPMDSVKRSGMMWYNVDRKPTTILPFSNANRTRDHIHPTQKPVGLFAWLIRTYTNKGSVVLDNCMGSGTTGVACILLNRQFIGIEKDKKMFKKAKMRIRKEEIRMKNSFGLVV